MQRRTNTIILLLYKAVRTITECPIHVKGVKQQLGNGYKVSNTAVSE